MNQELQKHYPTAKAISMLLYPHVEVVIHDLESRTIAEIFNNQSKRSVGDESLIEEVDDVGKLPDTFPAYYKRNWDGQKVKSVSAVLRDDRNTPVGLLCINLDLSKWEEMYQFLGNWIQEIEGQKTTELLFKNDWRERINVYVSDYLKNKNIILKKLTKDQKKDLVFSLEKEGAFQAKNAANYIADVLGVSRATIYNYLRE